MKNLLGGKGANLAEMSNLGIPVPPGFTITTEVCTVYYKMNRKYPPSLTADVRDAMAKVEKIMGTKFGDPDNPLLVSVRSGARVSMPGMMDTVLNLGPQRHHGPGPDQEDAATSVSAGTPTAVSCRCTATWSWASSPSARTRKTPSRKSWTTEEEEAGVKLDTDLTVDDLKELVRPVQGPHQEAQGPGLPRGPRRSSSGARSTPCSAPG